MFKRRVYLDVAAGVSGNPSSPHEEGRRSREMLEGARLAIARLVECKSDDVIFTGGATEANALAILGSVRARLHLKPDTLHPHALYLPSAHASIVENMKMAAEEGVEVDPLPIKNAQVDIEALGKMIRPETVLVSMEAVCGETGVVWNTREVGHTLRSATMPPPRCAPAARPIPHVGGSTAAPLLHVDASQAPRTEKLTRAHFGADLLTLDASKVGQTRGIGALICPYALPLAPLYGGGGQERGLRPGSEAPELAKEFAAALRAAAARRDTFSARAAKQREHLLSALSIPNLLVNEGKRQVPHILNLSLPGRDTDYLAALLDARGFAVSTKSACETDSLEGSRAVFLLTGDADRAKATLRISWDERVSLRDLTRFARALAESVAFIDSEGGG